MFPGLHRVTKALSGGHAEYWYAWRGGPQILKATAKTKEGLAREVARLAPAAALAYQAEVSPQTSGRFLAGLIAAYLDSSDYKENLAPRTQADYRRALDVVRADLGEMEVAALEARKARQVLIAWRDRYKAHPKTADSRMAALAMVLEWAKGRGELSQNPLTDWPRIYKVNRADIIWEPEHLELVLAKIRNPLAQDAILFAAYTGLRVSDVPLVTWSAVKGEAIIWQTGKSRGRRTVIIPITAELRAVLDRLPKPEQTGALTVLTNSKGDPWTAWGLQTTLQKAKQAVAKDFPKGSPLAHLRFHDLRGTAATRLIRDGATVEDVATILGWAKGRVEAIAARYVTGEAIAMAIVERMKRNKPRG